MVGQSDFFGKFEHPIELIFSKMQISKVIEIFFKPYYSGSQFS